jgi:hypothetical protein
MSAPQYDLDLSVSVVKEIGMVRGIAKVFVALLVVLTTSSVFANSVELLNFNGLGDLQAVGNFYDGGGRTGIPNYGVTFSSDFFGLRSYANGGSGNFAPTPVGTPAVFISSGQTGSAALGVMNVGPGFTTGINFFYSSAFAFNQNETVTIWSGANGTGTVLATLALANNNGSCTAPLYCTWSDASLLFSGTGHSVTFSGPSDQIGFTDITIGSNMSAVPEPSTLWLLGTGILGVAFLGMRRLRLGLGRG